MIRRFCCTFYFVTQIFVLAKSELYTDHWFVSVNTLNDLIRDLKSYRGQTVYLSVDLTFGILASRSVDDNPSPIISGTGHHYSDLTLEAFLRTIIATKTLKNAVIKFNFEEEEVLKPALQILKSKRHLLPFEIWLHADVLKGSNESQNHRNSLKIIDPKNFFQLVDEFENDVIVSLGWKYVGTRYEWKDVRAMANLVRCLNVYHPINIRLKVTLVMESVRQVRWLLGAIPQSTADLYQETDDQLYFENLIELNMALGTYPLYFSLIPHSDEIEKFRQIVATKSISRNYTPGEDSAYSSDWIVRPDRLESSPASCILSPYIISNSILINGGETTFLIMKQRYHVPASFSAMITTIDSLSRDILSYYISTFSVFAIKSEKMPSNLEDITTEKMWSALRHQYTKKLDHHTDGDDVADFNSTYYLRLSVGDNECSYISKAKLDVTRDNEICKNNQELTGDYVIFVIMHDGWTSIVLEDTRFTGLTLNEAEKDKSSATLISLLLIMGYLLPIYDVF